MSNGLGGILALMAGLAAVRHAGRGARACNR